MPIFSAIRGEAFVFDVTLIDSGSRPDFKSSPTLAAGDFKITKDEGALANLGTLPTVTPAAGTNVKISVSPTEMQAERVKVIAIDAAGAEWDDNSFTIITKPPQLSLVRLKTLSGFDERSGVTSEDITATLKPDYGVVFTAGGTPTKLDFDTNLLIGAVIKNKSQTSDDHPFLVILGGYFFNDTGDITESVFGIALDSIFGITEGGTQTVDTLWNSAGADLSEGTNGNGWTFITAPLGGTAAALYPSSGDSLEIWINPSMTDKIHRVLTDVNLKKIDDNANAAINLKYQNWGLKTFTVRDQTFADVNETTTASIFGTNIIHTASIAKFWIGQTVGFVFTDIGDPSVITPSGAEWRTIIKVTKDTGTGGYIRFHVDKPFGSAPKGASEDDEQGLIIAQTNFKNSMFGGKQVTTYYLDGVAGDDEAQGLDINSPIKTLAHLKTLLVDGDRVVFVNWTAGVAEVDITFTQQNITWTTLRDIAHAATTKGLIIINADGHIFEDFRATITTTPSVAFDTAAASGLAHFVRSRVKAINLVTGGSFSLALDGSEILTIFTNNTNSHNGGILELKNTSRVAALDALTDNKPKFTVFKINNSTWAPPNFGDAVAPAFEVFNSLFTSPIGFVSGSAGNIFSTGFQDETTLIGIKGANLTFKGGTHIFDVGCDLINVVINGSLTLKGQVNLKAVIIQTNLKIDAAAITGGAVSDITLGGAFTLASGAGGTAGWKFSNIVYDSFTDSSGNILNKFGLMNRTFDDRTIQNGVVEAKIASGTPTATVFITDLPSALNDAYNNMALVWLSGSNVLLKQIAVKDYDGATKTITLQVSAPVVPSVNDKFMMIPCAATAGTAITPQEVRDAMKLAPTAGAPAADSIDFELQRVKDIVDLPFAFDFNDTFGTIGPVAIWFTTDAKTTPLLYAEIFKSDDTTPANASEVAHRLSVKVAPIP